MLRGLPDHPDFHSRDKWACPVRLVFPAHAAFQVERVLPGRRGLPPELPVFLVDPVHRDGPGRLDHLDFVEVRARMVYPGRPGPRALVVPRGLLDFLDHRVTWGRVARTDLPVFRVLVALRVQWVGRVE